MDNLEAQAREFSVKCEHVPEFDDWSVQQMGQTPPVLCENCAIAFARRVRAEALTHQRHYSDDVMECSFSDGGPNYVDEDSRDGICRFTPHWRDCDHCAQRRDALAAEAEK